MPLCHQNMFLVIITIAGQLNCSVIPTVLGEENKCKTIHYVIFSAPSMVYLS
jgi:hypothetical protein